jgi:hypothetical protein
MWNNFFLKHVVANHMCIANKIEKEEINSVKQIKERHFAKRKVNKTKRSISKKNTMKDSFLKGMHKNNFLRNLVF